MADADTAEYSNRTNDPIRVFLDSKNADRSDDGRYTFYLNIDAVADTYDIYFQLRKVQCTYSWYNITDANNTLSFNGIPASFAPGNYNILDLIDLLNAIDTWADLGAYFEYNDNTGKVIISFEEVVSFDTTSTMAILLGFSEFPADDDEFYSDQLVDLCPIKTINFHLTTVPSRSFALYDTEVSRLVGTIFVGNKEPFGVVESSDETVFKESSLQDKVRSMEFVVMDQHGNVVDLQNGSFQMVVEFTFRPKKVWKLFYT